MITATKKFLNELEAICEKRKQEILSAPDALNVKGTTYYVSADGDDTNDGLSENTPWCSLEKASAAALNPGDGVRFRRGDLFRGNLKAKNGVSYGAYGAGDKPKFYSSKLVLADPALWELYDAERCIWKLKEKILDPGTLVFNDGEYHSYKLIPSYLGGKFVCRDCETRDFDMRWEMKRDLDIYWHFDSILTDKFPKNGENFPIPDMTAESFGELYLRCDRGNPGGAFRSIEPTLRMSVITVVNDAENVHIDNLCIKYTNFCIGAGGKLRRGLHVTNCEMGWIGGSIQMYAGLDPNYPAGKRGTVTRYGNAVEIYGGCDDYEVSSCYFYQVYDAAITHQKNTKGEKCQMTNVLYKDNLVEKCVYSIEYFLDMTEGDTESYMENIEMCGNILREAGYGWGQQRHNYYTPAHIKGWSYVNRATGNYTIHDNIFDRAAYRIIHTVAEKDEWCPEMYNNTYIQYYGNNIGKLGGNAVREPDDVVMDENADKNVAEVFGEKNAKLYVIK